MPDRAASAASQPLVVAYVLSAHGLQGELKCRLVTDFPERFTPGLRLLVGGREEERRVRSARLQEPHVYLRLEGVDDREAAEALRGHELLVSAAEAVPLPPGQFLWRDVLGLRVETTAGEPLGHVRDILVTGANDVYVVRGPRGEVLIPSIRGVVKEIAPYLGRIVVEPLPGMLPEPSRQAAARGVRSRRRTRRRPPGGTAS